MKDYTIVLLRGLFIIALLASCSQSKENKRQEPIITYQDSLVKSMIKFEDRYRAYQKKQFRYLDLYSNAVHNKDVDKSKYYHDLVASQADTNKLMLDTLNAYTIAIK